ncbi:MAG: hypothetical protein Q4D29_06680 [Lachnospiraceae bacterium]|nr:hypothetical protein [Lachnospiraceae bacterium]
MAIIRENFDDYVVDGKPMKEWYQSDGKNVDYSKLGFHENISTDSQIVIVDYGAFVIDTGVHPYRYHKGIDLSRLAGTLYRDEPYDDQRVITCIDGDDIVNILFNSIRDATVKDLIFREYDYRIVPEDVYVSAETKHVMISIRINSKEDIIDYAEDYNRRLKKR